MKNIIIISVVLILISCSEKETEKFDFTKHYWNLVVKDNDSNLIDFRNQPLYFIDNDAYFSNRRIGSYRIQGDKIIICDTSYYPKWIDPKWVSNNGIKSDARVDTKFRVYINNDSDYQVTYTFLIGKIVKSTKDSLIIDKIEGYGFPFKYNKRFVFYNDSTLYRANLNIDTLEFSSSVCFGQCPAFTLKITKGLNYTFKGGWNARKQGYHQGTLSKTDFEKLQHLVRMANIEGNKESYEQNIDAPYAQLIIDYNSNKTRKFSGMLGEFPARIRYIGDSMFGLYERIHLDTCIVRPYFELTSDFAPFQLHLPPPPLKRKGTRR